MYIEIAGIPQWLQIEGEAAGNPILLLVHGGPGASTRFASAAWESWRRHFTLVHWDQRGAGLTLAKNGPEGCQPMSFDRIVADGIEVAGFLRSHLRQERIVLLGHSWGSAIAIAMVKRRPDLFAACVGTGILVNFEENERENYRLAMQQARQTGNGDALAALSAIGSPPYEDVNGIRVLREWSDKLTEGKGDAPQPSIKPPEDFSPQDRESTMRGFVFSARALYRDLCAIDLPSLGPEFDVPVFGLMGTHDQQTPLRLAERYFDTIKAPHKALIRFAGCHHFVHMNRPDMFLDALIYQVTPNMR